MVSKLSHPACVFTEGSWSDFREEVRRVEPSLFEIIEGISPSKKYKLLKAEYLYGERITNLGTLCVPNHLGKLVLLDDAQVSKQFREQLSYCPTPLMLQLDKASEVFVEAGGRIVPLNVFLPGDLYGLYEALVPFTGCPAAPCWSINSGGRSVFFAAKVTDAISHKKLRTEFGVPSDLPTELSEQCSTMKAIAQHGQEKPWTAKILIFTRDWFSKHENSIDWLKFQHYLLEKAWWQSRSNRIQVEYSVMWEAFAKAVGHRNLKPSAYLVNTIKHLMLLASGATPGFQVADASEIVLPNRIIEKAYTDVYGLKSCAAIIMQPKTLANRQNDTSIYYSMSYPTLLIGSPAICKTHNVMDEVRSVKTLMLMLDCVLKSYGSKVYRPIKNVVYEYFHSDKDRFAEISNSQCIPEVDSFISSVLSKRFPGKNFPAYGRFFRGCIRISNRKS